MILWKDNFSSCLICTKGCSQPWQLVRKRKDLFSFFLSTNLYSTFLSTQSILMRTPLTSRCIIHHTKWSSVKIALKRLDCYCPNIVIFFQTDGLFVRAERLRHPLIFYLGHTATFYVNKLVTSGFIEQQQRIDSTMESSFAVGVDEMSWDDLLEENYPWSALRGTGKDRCEQFNSLSLFPCFLNSG